MDRKTFGTPGSDTDQFFVIWKPDGSVSITRQKTSNKALSGTIAAVAAHSSGKKISMKRKTR